MSASDNDNFEWFVVHPALNPFLIGWTEWNYYRVSGDVQRLRRVFLPLVKNYEWFMTYMRHTSGGIYGFVTPATRDLRSTDDFDFAFEATTIRAAETLAMARIATLVGRLDLARFFTAEYRRLGNYINQHFWDAEHQLYNDLCDPNHLVPLYRDPQLAGKFITEVTPEVFNKPAWTCLPLFAEIAPPDRVRALARLVQDPVKGFGWPNGIGYHSVDTTAPQWDGSGDDIDGSPQGQIKIWPAAPLIVQEGLKRSGARAVAQALAEKYCEAAVAAYMNGKMIKEALDPRKPEFVGHPSFVGWGGVAPIGNFIEYVLGIDVNVPQNTIVWYLHRTARHGLQHLKVGTFYVDLLCEERATAAAPCRLTVISGGAFTLRTVVRETVVYHRIQKGTTTIRVG